MNILFSSLFYKFQRMRTQNPLYFISFSLVDSKIQTQLKGIPLKIRIRQWSPYKETPGQQCQSSFPSNVAKAGTGQKKKSSSKHL